MQKACRDAFGQQLLPSLERSFEKLFQQLNDNFSKGIAECPYLTFRFFPSTRVHYSYCSNLIEGKLFD